MKTLFIILSIVFFLSCSSEMQNSTVTHEVVITVKSDEKVSVDTKSEEKIHRAMEVKNHEGELSNLAFTCEKSKKAYIKLFSGLSVSDVTRLWNDLTVIENETEIRDVSIFINSPGGDAFSGLALADLIEQAIQRGFSITAHASGIVASAAVPVFAVCSNRIATSGTIFMVHEAALWKWPGRETASDIKSQNELMELLRDRYIGKLVKNSKIDHAKWKELEKNTTWFSAETALEWGLVDTIE